MAKISEALKTDDCDAYASKAKAYRKLAQEIKKEFQTRYVDADGDLKQKSQTAYLLALKLDYSRQKKHGRKEWKHWSARLPATVTV